MTNAETVMNTLREASRPLPFEELAQATGLPPLEVSTAVSSLYVSGHIRAVRDEFDLLRWATNDNPQRDRVRFYRGPGVPAV